MNTLTRLTIWSVVLAFLLASGLFLGDRITKDSGYVLLAYNSYAVEMSLWTACFVVILGGFILWIIFSFGGFITNIPAKLTTVLRNLSSKRADIRLVHGAFWLRRDDPERALSILQQDAKQESLPALHWVLASEAARRLERHEQSTDYLKTAELLMKRIPGEATALPMMPQTFKSLLKSLKKKWREDWVYHLEFVGTEDALTRLSALSALSNEESLALEVVLARLAMVLELQAEAAHHIKRAKVIDAEHPLVVCLDLENQFGRTAHLEVLRNYLLNEAV